MDSLTYGLYEIDFSFSNTKKPHDAVTHLDEEEEDG